MTKLKIHFLVLLGLAEIVLLPLGSNAQSFFSFESWEIPSQFLVGGQLVFGEGQNRSVEYAVEIQRFIDFDQPPTVYEPLQVNVQLLRLPQGSTSMDDLVAIGSQQTLTLANFDNDTDLFLTETFSVSLTAGTDVFNGDEILLRVVEPLISMQPDIDDNTYFVSVTMDPGPDPDPDPDPLPPGAPSNLVATALSTSSIRLNWQDNSGIESGFRIERSLSSSSGFSEISTVVANVETFTDTGLLSNTQYFYRVRAFNSAGNSSSTSVASATTENDCPPSVVLTSSADLEPVTRASTSIETRGSFSLAPTGTSFRFEAGSMIVFQPNTTIVGSSNPNVSFRTVLQECVSAASIQPAGLSIEEKTPLPAEEAESSIHFYPNPVKDRLAVTFKAPLNKPATLNVIDKMMIRLHSVELPVGSGGVEIGMTGFRRDTYYVQIIQGEEITIRRIFKE